MEGKAVMVLALGFRADGRKIAAKKLPQCVRVPSHSACPNGMYSLCIRMYSACMYKHFTNEYDHTDQYEDNTDVRNMRVFVFIACIALYWYVLIVLLVWWLYCLYGAYRHVFA
jgi:hypothetical protein